jgi:hypothetical protein
MAAVPVSPERAVIDQARALIAALPVTDQTVEARAQVLLALDELWEAYEAETTANVLELFEALKRSLAKSAEGSAAE